MVFSGCIWLSLVLSGVGCFWPVLDGIGRFWRYMCIDFSSSDLINKLVEVYGLL